MLPATLNLSVRTVDPTSAPVPRHVNISTMLRASDLTERQRCIFDGFVGAKSLKMRFGAYETVKNTPHPFC